MLESSSCIQGELFSGLISPIAEDYTKTTLGKTLLDTFLSTAWLHLNWSNKWELTCEMNQKSQNKIKRYQPNSIYSESARQTKTIPKFWWLVMFYKTKIIKKSIYNVEYTRRSCQIHLSKIHSAFFKGITMFIIFLKKFLSDFWEEYLKIFVRKFLKNKNTDSTIVP